MRGLLALTLVFGCPQAALAGEPFGTQVGTYNGVPAYSNGTANTSSGIYNYIDGNYIGMKWQCVEYVRRYYYLAFGMNLAALHRGDANTFWGAAATMGLVGLPNGGTAPPSEGDILTSNGGTYGHVAIVRSVSGSTVHVIQQNWANNTADNDFLLTLTSSGGAYTLSGFSPGYPVQGWLRRSALVQAPNGIDVYYLQASRIYHVTSYGIASAMESAGSPGWVWAGRRQLSQTEFNQYTIGPEFVTTSSSSDGLLVRDTGNDRVYAIQGGVRRWIRSDAAVRWLGTNWWPHVINVPNSVISAYLPSQGVDIFAVGETTSGTINSDFEAAYRRLQGSCGTTSSWKGWPGTFATCLEFPQSSIGQALASGVSGITGTYQNFGNQSTRYGVINSSSRGTYGIWGAIYSAWQGSGYSGGKCGFPTSDEYAWGSNRRSDFEGGYIYWVPSTNTSTVVCSATTTCTSFSLSANSASPSHLAGSIAVALAGSPSGCSGGAWNFSSNQGWLSASPANGSGPGSVTLSWSQNTASQSRTAVATIAERTFTVNQAGAPPSTCTSFTLSPTSAGPGPEGGSVAVTLTGLPAGCSGGNWSASGNGAWLGATPTGGSGSGVVTVSWLPNYWGSARSANAKVAGVNFSVSQRGLPPPQFSDDPLVVGATTLRASHIAELRQSIEGLRNRYGLSAYAWTDPTIVSGATVAKAVHLTELRAALADVYAAAGRVAPVYTRPTIVAGTLMIAAVDVNELRAAVLGVW